MFIYNLHSIHSKFSVQRGVGRGGGEEEGTATATRVFLLVLSQDVAIKRIASCTCLLCPAQMSHVIFFLLQNIYFPISSLSLNDILPYPPPSLLSFYSIKLFDFRSNRRNFLMRMFRQSKKQQQKVKTKQGKKAKKEIRNKTINRIKSNQIETSQGKNKSKSCIKD